MQSKFTHRSQLGTLIDPVANSDPLTLGDQSRNQLISDLACMWRIRIVEDLVGQLVLDDVVKTPVHLAIGQEGVPVGISRHLRKTDAVFGGHRSHGHYLALDGNLEGLIAEIMCKSTGVAQGRGGSMHLIDREAGFAGSVPLVGATIPLGVGAALAAKMSGKGDVGVSYFGDGACEEGVLHESLNLAAVLHVPALFVVENNLYSSHLDIALRQPSDRTARYAEAHGVNCLTVDGNDLNAVSDAAETLISAARAGKGPGFLEAITYRWRGHVGPYTDIDVGVRRTAQEVDAWKKRDPIRRLAQALIIEGTLSVDDVIAIERAEMARVEAAIEKAHTENFPNGDTVLDHVYSDRKSQQ